MDAALDYYGALVVEDAPEGHAASIEADSGLHPI